jgi:hypothetical protein
MKAAIHKSYKSVSTNNNASGMSDDDVLLGEISPMKKNLCIPNGNLNGANSHDDNDEDAMSVDEKLLVGWNFLSSD